MVPTDKAKNNITTVCKKVYTSMIEKELSSNTFTKVNRLEDSVIDEHKLFLLKHRIKFDEDNIIYSIPNIIVNYLIYIIHQNIIKSQPELDII